MKNHYLFSQPHQPFFVLAFANAILSMFIFMLLFKGLVASEILSLNYHAYSFIFLMFTPAFLAFLFTTFPRFSATEPIEKEHYMLIFRAFLGGSLLFQIGSLFSTLLFILGMMLTLVAHARSTHILYNIYKTSKMTDKEDQVWILIAMAFGLLAHFIFIINIWIPTLHSFAIEVAIYLYLFILIFTVAQRMIPFFSNAPIEKHKERLKVIIGLLGLHVILEMIQDNSSFLVNFLLAYLIGKELYRWKLPFLNPNPLIWILHLALYWIPIAFMIESITNIIALSSGLNFLSLGLHTLVLGFFLTVLIGFGTRVTLGHSGNMMHADRLTTILFYWTQVVVLIRIFTSLAAANSWNFVIFFDLSITVWVVLFALWGNRFFPVLIFGKKLINK
jgi:uncharacterized protein involved in response to NO